MNALGKRAALVVVPSPPPRKHLHGRDDLLHLWPGGNPVASANTRDPLRPDPEAQGLVGHRQPARHGRP
eukprot:4916908-Pyramimonas_sp.AAC.1